MLKPNIAIMADFDIAKRPRPFRMAYALKDTYNVSLIARECSNIEDFSCFSFPPPSCNASTRTALESKILLEHCQSGNFAPLIYTPNRLKISQILESLPILDAIIIEDIALLPFACTYKQKHNAKILVDLREFYPLEYEDKQFQEGLGKFFTFLCATYLKEADLCITISKNIARRYKQDFGIESKIYYSLPPFVKLKTSPTSTPIKIIYHGFISKDRDSLNLLELARILGNGYKVFCMVLSNDSGFLSEFHTKAQHIENLEILPPVKLEEIVRFCNRFDIGVISLRPNSFNNANAMPNKLFEYIQSRLCVVSSPIASIKDFLESYRLGIVADEFGADSLAQAIQSLTIHDIDLYKAESNTRAKELSLITNQKKILGFLQELGL